MNNYNFFVVIVYCWGFYGSWSYGGWFWWGLGGFYISLQKQKYCQPYGQLVSKLEDIRGKHWGKFENEGVKQKVVIGEGGGVFADSSITPIFKLEALGCYHFLSCFVKNLF